MDKAAQARKAARDRFFTQEKPKPIEVELEPDLVLELRRPTEQEFEAACKVALANGADMESITANLEFAETLVRTQTYLKGQGVPFFEPGDNIRSGPFGGYYTKLRGAALQLVGNDPDERPGGNSESTDVDGPS